MEKILTLPRLGETMEQGTVISWNFQPGDSFQRGDVLLEMETDKMIAEVPALEAGTLLEILAVENAEVTIGEPLARVEVEGEAAAEPAPEVAAVSASSSSAPPPVTAPAPSTVSSTDRIRATPAARRLAQKRGLSLEVLVGSGPLGRIEKRDLPQASGVQGVSAQVANSGELTSVLQVADVRLRLFRRGSGGTPVVFLHGFGGDLFSFRYHLVQLAKEREVVAFDFPGHGGSSAPQHLSGIPELSRLLEQVLVELGVGTAHLVGHSMGAGVALEFASRMPQQIASLTMLAPAGLGPEINAEFVEGMARAATASELIPALHRLFYRASWVNEGMLKPMLEQRQVPEFCQGLQQTARELHERGVQCWQGREKLAGLGMPTRILWGREDQVIPAQHLSGIPGTVATHLFPECGHMPHVEAALDVLRVLREGFC